MNYDVLSQPNVRVRVDDGRNFLTLSGETFDVITLTSFSRASPVTAQALDDIELTSFEVLASWYTAGPEAMRRFVGPGPLLTDDRPLVEYHRSLPRDVRPLSLSTLRGDFSDVVR